jgi:signal transduction histidine kinase
MKFNWSGLKRYEGLSENENNAYKGFNLLLFIALLDLIVIGGALSTIQPSWPFYVCVAEFVAFSLLIIIHSKGYFKTARYTFFLLTTAFQVMASIVHGKSAGFDYLLFVICVLPMMFFELRRYYLSLFTISMGGYLWVQYLLFTAPPIIVIESHFPLYWNTFVTGFGLLIILYVFKRSYQKSQDSLKRQNEEVKLQKEEIESINNNLEKLIVQRTNKVLEHEKLFTEYANINAHKVRSPLARIVGLLNLIELEQDKEKILKEFLPLLQANAEELNDILDEVSKSLNAVTQAGEQHKSF